MISKRKQHFPLNAELLTYLTGHDRFVPIPLRYEDLLHFDASMPLADRRGKDTLWETVLYRPAEADEVHSGLKKIYALLKTAGNTAVMEHLHVERVDFCVFGNSKPFRVKIVNNFNDNHDYFYVKVPDASRVYGLELEHILSPNRINYLVDGHTLVEEHIVGIPGDQFIDRQLPDESLNRIRIAKEFVKFNERCFARLLGDMRSYNFVIDMTADFDDTQFRLRAIDFDQQCYEGRKSIYLPQTFTENAPYVELCMRVLNLDVAAQYQQEERSLMAKRVRSSRHRLNELLRVLVHDHISLPEKTNMLAEALTRHHGVDTFLRCRTMGELVRESLRMLLPPSERGTLLP